MPGAQTYIYAGGEKLYGISILEKKGRVKANGGWTESHTHTQTQGSHTHRGHTHTHTQSIVFYLFHVEEGRARRKKWERSWESICSLKRNLYLDVGKNVGYTDGG